MKERDCEEFVLRLDALLGDEVEPAVKLRVEEHAGQCPRCGALLESMRRPATLDAETDGAFLPGLMRRTSGSACQRAEDLLPTWCDDLLSPDDAELMQLHVQHCGACRELAAVLRALRRDLPDLAFVDPGDAFTAEVMAASKSLRQRPPSLEERLVELWHRLLARPRLAWEFATAASLVLVLLCGLPFSPLRPLPQHALAMVQVDPSRLLRTVASEFEPSVRDLASNTWEHTAQHLRRVAESRAQRFGRDHEELATSWQKLRTDFSEVGAGLRERNLAHMTHALHQVQLDLRQLFTRPAEAAKEATESS